MTRSHRIIVDARMTFRHPITLAQDEKLRVAIGGLMANAARPRSDGAPVIR
jgi:hypothetical protein